MKSNLTLAFLLILSFLTHAQNDDELNRKRLDVYFNTAEWGSDTVLEAVEDGYLKGLAHYILGDFETSEQLVNRSLHSEEPKSLLLSKNIQLLLCKIYRQRGQHSLATDALAQALEIASEMNTPDALGSVYVEFLEQLRAMRQYEEASEYINLLSAMENSLSDEVRMRYWGRRAAIIIEGAIEIDRSIPYLKRTIRWADSLNYPWISAAANLDLGYYYYNTKEESSLPYFKRANEISERLNHQLDRVTALHNLARYYLQVQDYDSVLYYVRTMERLATENSWVRIMADSKELQAYVLWETGKQDSALVAFKRFHDLKLQDFMLMNSKQVAEMTAKMGAISARNALLESENEKFMISERLDEEAFQKKTFLAMTISLGVLSIIVILLFFQQRKNVGKLTIQGKLIEKANSELSHAIEQKDVIYKELHHRVKNNLANLSGIIYLQERSLESEEAKLALADTRFRIQAMSVIHKGLYERDDIVQIELQSYFEELLMSLLSVYDDSNLEIDYKVDCEGMSLVIDTALPMAMIVNELLTNSLKYAFKKTGKGKLIIEGEQSGPKNWTVRVIDNGPGIPDDFDWEARKSLGMSLVQILSEELGAVYSYKYENELSISTINFTDTNDL